MCYCFEPDSALCLLGPINDSTLKAIGKVQFQSRIYLLKGFFDGSPGT